MFVLGILGLWVMPTGFFAAGFGVPEGVRLRWDDARQANLTADLFRQIGFRRAWGLEYLKP